MTAEAPVAVGSGEADLHELGPLRRHHKRRVLDGARESDGLPIHPAMESATGRAGDNHAYSSAYSTAAQLVQCLPQELLVLAKKTFLGVKCPRNFCSFRFA